MKRTTAIILIGILLCTCLFASADGEVWTCPVCRNTGNTGNFCPNCGTPRPVYGWTCPNCGQQGNTGMYCISCGSLSPEYGSPMPLPVYVTPEPVYSLPLRVNDVITLGNYGGQPVRWQVLAVEGTKALVISRYGLEGHCFHTNCAGQTWSNSSIRSWLNGGFLSQAFTAEEKAAILVSYVDESASQAYSSIPAKRFGDSTQDRMFLLSYKELVQYIPDSQMRQCVPTTHALSGGCNYSDKTYLYGQPACWWWLRTPAYNNNALVVSEKGVVDACMISNIYGVVRPAMWLDLTLLSPYTEVLDYWTSFQTVTAPYGTPNPGAAMMRSVTAAPTATPYKMTPTPAPKTTPIPTQPSGQNWQSTYQALISGGNFGPAGKADAQSTPAFGLCDLDQDGIPELMIDSGHTDTAKRTLYVFHYVENTNSVTLLGEVGQGKGDLYTFLNLPGVLFHSEYTTGANEIHTVETYFRMQDGMLVTQKVFESVSGSTAWSDTSFTNLNPVLSGTVELMTLEEIQHLGWNMFFTTWDSYRG